MNDYNKFFAKYYDLINSQKDYFFESESVFNAIKKYYSGNGRTLADVGCGTGNYSLLFEKLGFKVCGYDISPDMINVAQAKQSGVKFLSTDFGNVLDKFDIITALFNVVNSLGNYNNLCQFFHSISKSLNEDSLFIFDSWNGVAVFRNPPINKTKIIERDKYKIVREVVPLNNLFEQTSIHTYNITLSDERKIIDSVTSSLHNFFFYISGS